MIEKSLLERLNRACTTQRWTDHLRPLDLTVQGKHAHMMTIAWVLGRQQEDLRADMDLNAFWVSVVEGGLFELLRKCVILDLKSQLFSRLRREAGTALNEYAFGILEPEMSTIPGGFFERFKAYFSADPLSVEGKLAVDVLRAASCLATAWEFEVIESANAFMPDSAQARYNIEQDKRNHQFLPGFVSIDRRENDTARFVDMCGRLRFQERWSQTPIVPRRAVLDHELMVANLAYLVGVERQYADPRRVNDYFGGLFHDLLESLTRDIVSGLKNDFYQHPELADVLESYEKDEFDDLRRLVPEGWHRDLEFFVWHEFEPRSRVDRAQAAVLGTCEEDGALWMCCDGDLVKDCDVFAAYGEAYFSLNYGTKSRDLKKAIYRMFCQRESAAPEFRETYDTWYEDVASEIDERLKREVETNLRDVPQKMRSSDATLH